MSNVPDGARLSDDGQWWWDETNQQWNAVHGDQQGAGGQGGGVADKFADEMAQAGVTVDKHELPDADTLKAAIDYAQDYLEGMDPKLKAGFDEASKDEAVAIALADDQVNVAPALSGLLKNFDNTPGQPISVLLTKAKQASDAAAQSA